MTPILRRINTAMLTYTSPHQRGFGTQSRFHRDDRFGSPGPYTARPDLQLASGMRTIVTDRRPTKAQSFDTTAARFTMNDAINCALQNLPDKGSPGPAKCAAARHPHPALPANARA